MTKPNDWTKSIHTSKRQNDLTPTKEQNLEYWTALKEFIEASGSRIRSQKPAPQHWTTYSVGRSNFTLSAIHSVRDNFLRVDFMIAGKKAKQFFDVLKDKYAEDSKVEIAPNISWDRLDDKQVSGISVARDADVSNRADWPNQFRWLLTNLEKMDAFFRPKIKSL